MLIVTSAVTEIDLVFADKFAVASDAKQKKHVFLKIKNSLKKKHHPKKLFFYYYLQFKGRKVFFNTLECLFMLYTSCKTLHSVCQLHFH